MVESRKKSEVADQTQDQQASLLRAIASRFLDPDAQVVIDHAREDEKAHKTPVPPGVEQVAGREQEDQPRPAPQREVQQYDDWSEDREDEAVE
jgi:hypothetical protein